MGVIKKQSILATVYSYVGVVLGFVTSALMMPKIFASDQIGFIKLIIAVTGVFAAVFSLGIGQLMYRMFPVYEKDKYKRRQLFVFSMKVALVGCLVAFPLYMWVAPDFLNLNESTTGLAKSYVLLFFIFLSVVARLFYTALFGYIRMMNRVAIDAFIQNVFHKGGIFILILLYFFNVIDFQLFVYLYAGIFFLFPLIILWDTWRNKGAIGAKDMRRIHSDRRSIFSKSERSEFFRLMVFGLLTTLGGSLYLYLDTLMVNYYLGESEVGIYGTMFLFGVIVIVPARSLKSIAVSVLSRAFNENDLENVKSIYQKSSITLLIIGGYIFMGVWCNMYAVFGFLPEEFQLGYYVVLFIGVAQLFDMLSGVNNELIAASPSYRLNTWFTILSIIVGLAVNVLLIPSYGIDGAGMATLITVVVINSLRMVAVYRIHGMHPFTLNTLKVIVLIVLLTWGIQSIPDVENYLLNLLLKGSLITLVYVPAIYFSKVSTDINSLIDGVLNKLLK